jgi:hypothetical protein
MSRDEVRKRVYDQCRTPVWIRSLDVGPRWDAGAHAMSDMGSGLGSTKLMVAGPSHSTSTGVGTGAEQQML